MKYWTGYIVALIFAACGFALKAFAAAHVLLIDIVYPYISRMILSFLSLRTGGVGICVWQLLVFLMLAGIITGIVLSIWKKHNPIRWIGWTLAVLSILFTLSTGFYGLNRYNGPLSSDIRLEMAEYTTADLQNALVYFQDAANDLADDVERDSKGNLKVSFGKVADAANEGFLVLQNEKFISVFAGNKTTVKKQSWGFLYRMFGCSNKVFPLTGEATVNAGTPGSVLPFTVCRAMAKRICIVNGPDSAMAAFLACIHNDDPLFQYSGYLMAYRYCYLALQKMPGGAASYRGRENSLLKRDMDIYLDSFAVRSEDASASLPNDQGEYETRHAADLLVSWHLQEIIAPLHAEDDTGFDPLDETQVDLSGLPNAKGN